MIRFSLKCDHGHSFDSWFSSNADFERLEAGGLLSCSVCGSAAVQKSLMAPSVRPNPDERPLSGPASPAEQAMRELRRKIEATSENVGTNFATEARRIHEGEAPERPIHGKARVRDAAELVRDGIPVAPLPWGDGETN